MILTVALSPSIEKTAVIDGVDINKKNKIVDYRMVLGSSAIYSALVIKVLQGEPFVIGFSGGVGGRYIKNFMDKSKLKSDILYKDNETRFIINIIDSVSGEKTSYLDDTFTLDKHDIKNFKHKINNHLKDVSLMLINSDGIENDINSEIVEKTVKDAKEHHLKIVSSLSNVDLRNIISKSPFAVALNMKDLRELEINPNDETNRILESLRMVATRNSIKYIGLNGIDRVYLITKNKITAIEKEDIVSDEIVDIQKDLIAGVLSVSISRKYQNEKIIKLIGGALLAFKIENFPNMLVRKEIDDLSKHVKVIEIYNNKSNKFIEQ